MTRKAEMSSMMESLDQIGRTITHVPVAAVRYSQGQCSSGFLEAVTSGDVVRVHDAPDLDVAKQMIQQGKVKAIIYISSGFHAAVAHNKDVTLTVYLDNTDPLSAQAISSHLTIASQQLHLRVNTLRLLMYKGAALSAVMGDFTFLAGFTVIMVGIASSPSEGPSKR